jgi:hypothetical protein
MVKVLTRNDPDAFNAVLRGIFEKVVKRERGRAFYRDFARKAEAAAANAGNNGGNGRHEVDVIADLVAEASEGRLDRAAALRFLLTTTHGNALLRRLQRTRKQQQ